MQTVSLGSGADPLPVVVRWAALIAARVLQIIAPVILQNTCKYYCRMLQNCCQGAANTCTGQYCRYLQILLQNALKCFQGVANCFPGFRCGSFAGCGPVGCSNCCQGAADHCTGNTSKYLQILLQNAAELLPGCCKYLHRAILQILANIIAECFKMLSGCCKLFPWVPVWILCRVWSGFITKGGYSFSFQVCLYIAALPHCRACQN